MLVEIVLFIAVTALVAYIVIQFIPVKSSGGSFYNLSVPKDIQNTKIPWDNRPSSLRFAIYVNEAPRTLAKVDCISTNTSFAPSCDNYTFKACMCEGVNCSRCDMTDSAGSYLSKLLSIGNSLEFWASGYTSQNDKPYVPAILKIKTASDTSQYYMESVSLPAIPLQVWTVITIVKEGRRFDVYYGAKLVATSLCSYVPVQPNASDNLAIGNKHWKGQIGLITGLSGRQTSGDVEKDVASIVNTRGIPFAIENLPLTFTMPSMSVCPSGNCSQLPTVKPLNPFTAYSSSFS